MVQKPVSIFVFLFILQKVFQEQNCLTVSLKTQTDEAFDACHTRIGDLSETLPLINIGQVHFHRRYRYSFQGI